MKALRHLGLVLWLALSLVAGQRAVALHDLGHATDAIGADEDGGPAQPCAEHSACAQLSGALPSPEFTPSFTAAMPPRAALPAALDAALAPRLSFRSRAPPRSLG